jgi:hypothetical protein
VKGEFFQSYRANYSEIHAKSKLARELTSDLSVFRIDVKNNPVIRGMSGNLHSFDLLASKGSASVLLDLVPSKRWAGAFEVMRMYAKLSDILPEFDGALIADRVGQGAARVARKYYINIVPSGIAFMRISEMLINQASPAWSKSRSTDEPWCPSERFRPESKVRLPVRRPRVIPK